MSTALRGLTAIIAPSEMLVPAPGICPDAYFNTAAETGLVWLPERGMGWLRVTDAPYDAEYFDKYVGYSQNEQGRAITAARVALVEKYVLPFERLIDVGIGCGDFVDSCTCDAYGYDINPAAIEWLNARGRFVDPYKATPDALTFWDALEHIPDVHRMIANAKRWVFASLPIVPGDGPPALNWKHLRRDEHCFYFTRKGFIAWMGAQGFECVECHAGEILLGREDIETFAFRRRADG
jgi:hypothetical protein